MLVMSGAALIMTNAYTRKRRKRRWWRTNLFKKRNGTELFMDLKSQEISGQYKNFTRMSPSDFEHLLQKIGPRISRKDTYLRTPISAQDRSVLVINVHPFVECVKFMYKKYTIDN